MNTFISRSIDFFWFQHVSGFSQSPQKQHDINFIQIKIKIFRKTNLSISNTGLSNSKKLTVLLFSFPNMIFFQFPYVTQNTLSSSKNGF